MASKSRAPRARVIDVLLLAAELGAIVRAAYQLEASESVQREALYYATVHTRELMIAGAYTTYNEALRSCAQSVASGLDSLRDAVLALERSGAVAT